LPGFIDTHNHFSLTSFSPAYIDCRTPPQQSISGVLKSIEAAAKGAPKGRWLTGYGFGSRSMREARGITRWELDEAAPDNPVCVLDASVHACFANSAALALAGIDRTTPDPPRGRILRETEGEPNGTLWESAMNPMFALSISAYLDRYGDDVPGLVHANCMRHLSYGITGVGDALVTPEVREMYLRADSRNRLPFTVHQMTGGDRFYDPPEKMAAGDIDDGQVSDRLRGGTIKLFVDPVFPSYAMFRYRPSGSVEPVGVPNYSQEEVDRLVTAAHRRGLQVALHCIGTRAIEMGLDAFENAQRLHPRENPRFRIEHFTLPTMSQIDRAGSLGVVVCSQPPFIFTNGGRYLDVVGDMGGDIRILPFQTMLSSGVRVAASADSPCAPVEPLLGLYAAVTRLPRGGGPPIKPEEAVSPIDGLRMYTINAAYAMGRDAETGSLEPGKRADMVVLSNDPTEVDPVFIPDITVEQTYVDGECLYRC
jgi:predicted amidohydrolase YtcJ